MARDSSRSGSNERAAARASFPGLSALCSPAEKYLCIVAIIFGIPDASPVDSVAPENVFAVVFRFPCVTWKWSLRCGELAENIAFYYCKGIAVFLLWRLCEVYGDSRVLN